MSVFRPFKAVRPVQDYVSKVAALPYDVMNTAEARELVKNNPYSFLHISKAQIDFPEGTDQYSDPVYKRAAQNLQELESCGICKQDETPLFYIYTQEFRGRSQTGLVGCASVDGYLNGTIKANEKTLAKKEADRIRNVEACKANTGPIFLAYRSNRDISNVIDDYKKTHEPVYDFVANEVRNQVWVIKEADMNQKLEDLFSGVNSMYIADGHHRCASAAKVALKYREANPDYTGEEEFNYFLAVAFPSNELEIMDYNRVARIPEDMGKYQLMTEISKKFQIECQLQLSPYRPEDPKTFGMYVDGSWYKLTALPGTYDAGDPVDSLDVSILQNNLIAPILGIEDPRTSDRIDFVGGIRGLKELERRAKTDMNIAFAMYPTSIVELMAIADAGQLMPPKSTWFEPKLLSGLFVHKLED